MSNTISTREARLKPHCADSYPQLPVSRWTSAEALAEIVASGHRDSSVARTLLEADFEFRGGHPHRWQAGRAHTRTGEVR